MQQSNINKEKIRSILSAMERSIDVARRKRLNQSDDVSQPACEERASTEHNQPQHGPDTCSQNGPSPTSHPSHTPPSNIADRNTLGIDGEKHAESATTPADQDAQPPRLKARPKRPSAFFHPPAEQSWQSRVG
jgi:hypothetical protein